MPSASASPFPGMDPYLEARWSDVHAALCPAIRAALQPLLPIAEPERFFRRLSGVADAVVVDHYIGGDGSAAGSRTRRTPLPQAMQAVDPASVTLEYRDQIVEIARRHFRGQLGVNIDGFAGRMLPRDSQVTGGAAVG